MRSLRILLTNLCLHSLTGTELYIYDLARRLLARGHRPVVYTPLPGQLATRLIEQSIPVVRQLEMMTESPDVIHGHHSLETMTALWRFPGVPAIFVCHDCSAWHDHAPRSPRIHRYVAVDVACRDRLTLRDGISAERVVVLNNGVDLERFRPRGPLPERPRRALLFSNYADARTRQVVEAACSACGVHLDVLGKNQGNACDHPETVLPQYDIVFAKGRCAWESLAVGAAVVVCDANACGPLVTSDRFAELAAANFGRRLLCQPLDEETLVRQLRRFDAADAADVSRQARQRAALDHVVDQLVELYGQVIEEHRQAPPAPAAEWAAAAEFLHWWSLERQSQIESQLALLRRRPSRLQRWWRSLKKRLLPTQRQAA